MPHGAKQVPGAKGAGSERLPWCRMFARLGPVATFVCWLQLAGAARWPRAAAAAAGRARDDAGTIVLDLLADYAPEHVALFIKTAKAGEYDAPRSFGFSTGSFRAAIR